MKIKKIISALLASAMIFGMSALAADVKFDDTVTYTDGAETITVNVYAGSNVTTMDGYSILSITFDKDVFSVKSATTTQESATAVDNGDGTISWCNETTAVTTITSDPLMTVVFDVLDSSKVVGSTFGIDESNSGLFADNGNTAYDFSGVSVTVTAATPAGPSVTKGTEAGTVTEYTFENSTDMEGKKVLMTTTATAGTSIKEDTRFYVSYQGGEERIFGCDIWSKLAQGSGSITVENVKFGIIVDESLSASDFTFDVR